MLVIADTSTPSATGWQYNRLISTPYSSGWTGADEREARIHRIHAYPARFPAFIVREALDFARERGVIVNRVADIFCGSGTVAYEAGARNLEFWGCDINPVATLLTRVKSTWCDPVRFEEQAARIAARAVAASAASSLSAQATARLLRWYAPHQFDDLVRLQNAIAAEVGGEGNDALAFACAFSAILKSASQWRVRSVKPANDPTKHAVPVIDAFRRQCRLMAAAWSDMAAPLRGNATVIQGNVLHVDRPADPVDLVVTSPPYATSYEYADLHQLSALWLGFADDHRALRDGFIGTSSRRANLARAMEGLNAVGMQIVFSLFGSNRPAAEAVATYFLDMQKVALRCYDFLRPGGMSVFVIGNTTMSGVRIDNANHLVESLLDAGFVDLHVVKRQLANKPNTPYRAANGRLSSVPVGPQVYAEEYIVMAHRR